jgi:hypothetical protein
MMTEKAITTPRMVAIIRSSPLKITVIPSIFPIFLATTILDWSHRAIISPSPLFGLLSVATAVIFHEASELIAVAIGTGRVENRRFLWVE